MDGHVMTLANSIIGVSILAMPYCFKQCGILLSIIILLISSIISRLACHFLLKSAIIARRKTFEFLALHIFGAIGKLSIEIGIIGFLLGTCIAFFVVMGDLGPEIISEISGIKKTTTLRNIILILLGLFCILPLGLLRNVASFGGVSRATIGFYCCLVLKIIIEALPRIFIGDWYDKVILWEPDGLLQCLPIFSMALFCQTQLFEIYQEIPNASLEKMNGLIRIAVNICTWVYIFVGTFGYIAFCKKPFTGNILLSFPSSSISDVIKIGFILSLVFSFPLVIFPCRASLYSLIYKESSYTTFHEGTTTNYIPEGKFKMLTVIIVSVSLMIALMIPNIELVLGLVGSTIGVMICVLFPVTCFICISPKNTNERILAQIMLFIGVIVMVLGTYANLYAYEETKMIVKIDQIPPLNLPVENVIKDPNLVTNSLIESQQKFDVNNNNNNNNKETVEVRHEPPQPEEPNVNQDKPQILPKENNENLVSKPVIVDNNQNPPLKIVDENKDKQEPVVEPVFPQETNKENPINVVVQDDKKEKNNFDKTDDGKLENSPITVKIEKSTIKSIGNIDTNTTVLSRKNDEVDIEAIKKEEIELKEQEKLKDSNQILIDTLQQQNEVQKEIVKQQKRLIEVIEKQQKQQSNRNSNDLNAEKVKAVKQIESIALKAIESISKQEKLVKTNDNEQISNLTKLVKNNKTSNSTAENVDTKQQKVNLLPIPLAFANKVNETEKKADNKSSNNTATVASNADNKNIVGRDILSENLQRSKRDIDDRIVTTTEKSIIKMICNLSVPDVINANLKHLEIEKENHLQDLQVRKNQN